MNYGILKRMEVLGLNDTTLKLEYKESVDKLDKLLIRAVENSNNLGYRISTFENNRTMAINANIINEDQLHDLDLKILSLKNKKEEIDNKIQEIISNINKNNL